MDVTFKHKKILEDLFSTKDSVVVAALKELRQSGDISVIPYLVDLFVTSHSEKIKQETETFLKDLKDDKAAKPLSEALENQKYHEHLESLAAICWQADIDFAPYINTFTKLAIEGDYQTSIEAFTVIEETLPNLTPGVVTEQISFLKEKITEVDEMKVPLIKELITTLENAV